MLARVILGGLSMNHCYLPLVSVTTLELCNPHTVVSPTITMLFIKSATPLTRFVFEPSYNYIWTDCTPVYVPTCSSFEFAMPSVLNKAWAHGIFETCDRIHMPNVTCLILSEFDEVVNAFVAAPCIWPPSKLLALSY